MGKPHRYKIVPCWRQCTQRKLTSVKHPWVSGACGQWTLPHWCQCTQWKMTSVRYPWGSHTNTRLYMNVHGENWPVLSICGEATQIQDCTTVVSMYMVKNQPVLVSVGKPQTRHSCTTLVSMYMVRNWPVLGGIHGGATNKTWLYHLGVNVTMYTMKKTDQCWSQKQDTAVPH